MITTNSAEGAAKQPLKPLYKKSLLTRIGLSKHIYILLLPAILFYVIFHYIPMFGTVIAFQDYSVTKGILGSKWVGFKNFLDFFRNYKFGELLVNTLRINIMQLAIGFPTPIVFALLLNELRNLKFKKAVQTITYMPHFISTVIIASLLLTFLSSEGLFNGVRAMFGLEKISFMTEPKYFPWIYVLSGVWQQLGWNTIIYISAIASISPELYEAATIDGAGRFKQAIHVTLPGISETIVILLIMNIGTMLSLGYEKIILLYNPTIYETADVISTYVYRRGILEGNFGHSAAVGMFNSIVNYSLLMISNTISRKVRGSGLW